MSDVITELFRYPVKGLSEESLHTVDLDIAAGMPADRLFAIAHANSRFNTAEPAWVERRNFLVVAHSPEIGPIHCQFDRTSNTLTLSHKGGMVLQEQVGTDDMDDQLTAALNKVTKGGQPGPYKLVSAGNTPMTDSPTKTVSIMNRQSLRALEKQVGEPLQQRRFRGNIWFDGVAPWQEHDWVGNAIYIGGQTGGVRLFVTERIQRCAAIDADPELGSRNIAVLKQLSRSFSHLDFGVLAEVEVAGSINVGDTIGRRL